MIKIGDIVTIVDSGFWHGERVEVQDIDINHILVHYKSTIDYCDHWFWLETGEYEKV